MTMPGFIIALYFFLCTFTVTYKRNALSGMKPVASSWMRALVGSDSIVTMCG